MQSRACWLVSLVTHTPGLSIEQRTLGVGGAEYVGTGTLAVWSLVGLRADTDLLWAAESVARAVLVPLTCLDVDTLGAGGAQHGAGRTAALVTAGQVRTSSTKAAGGDTGALVDINTSDLRVPGVSRLALTHEAARQVGAEAVLPAGAGGATLVDVHAAGRDVVGIVSPASLALTESFLVHGLAVGVLGTLDSQAGLRAGGGGRVTHEGGEAGAGEAAESVDTDGVDPADAGAGLALVNIQTESSGSREASLALALSAHTLRVVGAVKVGLAESSDLGGLTGNISVSGKSWWTVALKPGVCVSAHGISWKR